MDGEKQYTVIDHTADVGLEATGETLEEAIVNAAIGMFFGPQSVGVGIGGNNAQVLLNNNDDFSRFIMMIWSLYAGFELLNADFVTVGYSFDA